MQRNYLQLLSLLVLSWLLVSCEQAQIDTPTADTSLVQAMPKAEINAFVQKELDKGQVFRWEKGSAELVWSAMSYGQHHAVIGYQPAGFTNLNARIHEVDITQPAWRQVRQALIELVVDLTAQYVPGEKLSEEDLLLSPVETVLPSFEIKIMHPEILRTLRARAEVRYVEPMNYSMEEVSNRSDSGCGIQPATNIPTADYTTVAPGAKVPWNFHLLNIPTAWNTSNGDNVKVAVIDTGTSPSQPKLGSQFSSGYSTNRSLSRFGTYVSSWWWWADPDGPDDDCGHGTQMSGLIAAPRTSSGSTTGVAWKADLASYRATGDVVINSSSEKNGVRDALVMAGNDNKTKIISMSIGDVFWSSTVADGVYYAYNRGKLIFAAAGTSLDWTSWWGVIFPANMSETVAVTGVKEGYPLVRCSSCHDGSEVDFIVPMQRRNDNGRTSLTLAMSGNTPSYVGGSSAATATTAGVAALVWATNTNQSRTQVLNRLKQAASIYPARNGNFGWGIIDAAYAVTH